MKNEYWECIIGPVESELLIKVQREINQKIKSKITFGLDYPLRSAVKDAFIDLFGKQADVCASGWGIDEKRYNLLRTISVMTTDEIEKMLNTFKKRKEKF